MVPKAAEAGELGKFSRNDTPESHERVRLGSIGIFPRNGTLNLAAMLAGVLSAATPEILNSGLCRNTSDRFKPAGQFAASLQTFAYSFISLMEMSKEIGKLLTWILWFQ